MLKIRSHTWDVNGRPCNYSFAMQDDSVFADFNLLANGCLSLVRISFDGFGCWSTKDTSDMGVVNKQDSEKLINAFEKDRFDISILNIISSYLSDNIDHLWGDALECHELI